MHRCPSRAILRHPSSRSCCLPTSRALHASASHCCSVHRRSSTPPQVAAEKISLDGAERSNRWPQVPKQFSLRLDYTSRSTVFSRPSVRLVYTAQGTGAHLHPVLPAVLFATHLISSRRALPHLDYVTMRFRGDAGSRRCACAAAGPAGSGSFWGSLPPYNYSHGVLARPSDPSIPHLDRTARCSRRCVRAAARRRARGGLGLRDAADGVPSMRDSLYPAPSTLTGVRTRTSIRSQVIVHTWVHWRSCVRRHFPVQFGSEEIGQVTTTLYRS
ncbi:hypothetical protein DFH08DRAFT_356519 [Mycena albidolilacea]|uniref:Uncharacterized protein n=1 Tax=Mycena albidolilacea TaxID=1033008 RepID=A0AAD6ZGZ8_9AGAR|nr:hypothetical protein DFH08DRAFT_356519 [Mycena albidolilacea]